MATSPNLIGQAPVMDIADASEMPLLPAPPPANITVRAFMDPAALSARTAFFVRFLDLLHATDGVRASHRRTVELLRVREGFHLLDVGCGTGNFTREAASLVRTTGGSSASI